MTQGSFFEQENWEKQRSYQNDTKGDSLQVERGAQTLQYEKEKNPKLHILPNVSKLKIYK